MLSTLIDISGISNSADDEEFNGASVLVGTTSSERIVVVENISA